MQCFRMRVSKLISTIIASLPAFLITAPTVSHAEPYYGATYSYAAIAKEPEHLRGFQFMFDYDPQTLKWRKFNVYFDAGYTHFSDSETPYYSSISIYSIAPVVRYNFKKRWVLQPYLELSIGAAYLNHTRFEDRNLGMHFAFQDRVGLGIAVGEEKQFSLGIHTVHYSNAHLSENNSGITVPLMLDVSYRFQ